MPAMAPSKILMLGRVQPRVRAGFLNPPRTSPRVPQNLLRQTLLGGGLRATGAALQGLGQVIGQGDDIMGEVNVEAGDVAASAGAGVRVPGPAVPSTAAPVVGAPMGFTPRVGGDVGFNLFGRRVGLGVTLGVASLAFLSGTLSAVHGWRRDRTPIAAWGWFTLGTMFPIITPLVAVGQGFARPRKRRR